LSNDFGHSWVLGLGIGMSVADGMMGLFAHLGLVIGPYLQQVQ